MISRRRCCYGKRRQIPCGVRASERGRFSPLYFQESQQEGGCGVGLVRKVIHGMEALTAEDPILNFEAASQKRKRAEEKKPKKKDNNHR